MPPLLACLVALPQIVHPPSLYGGIAFGAAVVSTYEQAGSLPSHRARVPLPFGLHRCYPRS